MGLKAKAHQIIRGTRRTLFLSAFLSGAWSTLFLITPDTPWLPSTTPYDHMTSLFSSDEFRLSSAAYEAANEHGIDPYLIRAMVSVESGDRIFVMSERGARGPMQLMPETAKEVGVRNIYDPSDNINGGTKYFKSLLDKFDNNTELALAAYNAGPKAVRKYKGIPPYPETKAYVKKVMDKYRFFAAS